jgi:phosphonoacetaldehyde hydrolase
MQKKLQAVIFDWAGTVIDYGSFAPIYAFLHAFAKKGVEITLEEAREPMGMLKRDHIKEILKKERVRAVWLEKFNRDPDQEDINLLYHSFEKSLFVHLHKFTDPLPGVIETVDKLRERNIKIGSTTGYTREMMDVVEKYAMDKGYRPDFLVCADEVKRGRPFPFMIFQNMIQLEAFPPVQIVKVGDTVSDIKEGKNAGVWSIGIIKGSSELGLTEEEVAQLNMQEYERLANKVTEKFKSAGADYVIDSIVDLPPVLDEIEEIL